MPRPSRWHRAGVTPRTERILDIGGRVLVFLLAAGWTYSIATTDRSPGASPLAGATSVLTAALTSTAAPTAAYLTDASLNALTGELRGTSGKLRAQIAPAGAAVGSSRVDLQACKLEYSIVSPK